MIIISAAQNTNPAIQLRDENATSNTTELKVVNSAKKALNTTERTPLVLESGRIKKDSCCDCIYLVMTIACVTLCVLGILGGIGTGAYYIFRPRPEIHPNECDQYNQNFQEIVNSTGSFMQQKFEILKPNQNVTQSIVSSFEDSLTSMLRNQYRYIRCDKTSTLLCVNFKFTLFDSLQGVHPLISNAVNTYTSVSGLNHNSAETEAIRMHLCDTVDKLTKGCHTHSFCDFIP